MTVFLMGMEGSGWGYVYVSHINSSNRTFYVIILIIKPMLSPLQVKKIPPQ